MEVSKPYGIESSDTYSEARSRALIAEERRALLQRVLWSPQIAKSVRIRKFLEFVCERAAQDPSAEIHEQEIGCKVFGKNPDYDTSIDNVVRVAASQTRRKLEQYFVAEGADEAYILEIPKGSYLPVYRQRMSPPEPAPTAPVAPPSEPAPSVPAPSRSLTHSRTFLGLMIGTPWLIAGICAALLLFRPAPNPSPSVLDANPSLNALWSQLLPRNGRTDVIVTDSGLSLSQELQPHQLTLAQYLDRNFWNQKGQTASQQDLQNFVQRMVKRRLTSIGSVTTAFRVAEMVDNNPARVAILSPRDFTMSQMKTDNVVLLGSSIANPWTSLLEDQLNFHFGYDRNTNFAYFENRNPRSGEQTVYRTDDTVSYCEIAFLPNSAQTGNVLLISGAEVEGTEGGGEYITNGHSLEQLRSFMNIGKGRFPYFEVLLKSSKIGGSTTGLVPVAYRLIKP
jgi:hypothetical protein